MKPILAAAALVLGLSACQQPVQYPTESQYSHTETRSAQSVERCRVLEARRITIGAQDGGQRRSSYGRALGQPEEQIGTIAGALLGAAVGKEIDRGAGTAIGAAIGGLAGRAGGARIAARRMAQPGVEYSVLLDGAREQIIAQHLAPGDRIARPGTTCRIATGPGGARVLPAEQLPDHVRRPRQTTFSN